MRSGAAEQLSSASQGAFSSSDAAQMKSNMSATALRSVRTGNKSLLHTDSHIWKWTLKHMRLRVVCDWSTPWANGFSQSEKLPWLTDACTTTHTQTSPCCAVLMVFLELPFSFRGVEGVRMAGVRKQSGLWVRGGNKKVSGFRKTSKLGRTKRKEQGTKWRCINRWEEWILGGGISCSCQPPVRSCHTGTPMLHREQLLLSCPQSRLY